MASSNGNILRVTGPLCGEFTGHRWIPRTKISDVELWRFLLLNKRSSKQSWGWWFKTLSRSLWRHCNVHYITKPPISQYYLNCDLIIDHQGPTHPNIHIAVQMFIERHNKHKGKGNRGNLCCLDLCNTNCKKFWGHWLENCTQGCQIISITNSVIKGTFHKVQ